MKLRRQDKQKGLLCPAACLAFLTSFQLTSCPSKLQPSVCPHPFSFHHKWSFFLTGPLGSAPAAFLITQSSFTLSKKINMEDSVLSGSPRLLLLLGENARKTRPFPLWYPGPASHFQMLK